MNTRLQALVSVVLIGLSACAAPPAGDKRSTTASSATPPTPTTVAAFDPAAGELPEGLTTKAGFAYVGFAPLGEIAKVDLKTGAKTRFAKLPKPVPNKGFMTGLAFGPDGSLYAALVSFDPSVQPGIYRVSAAGGDASLFAKDAKMVFPNGLSFDAADRETPSPSVQMASSNEVAPGSRRTRTRGRLSASRSTRTAPRERRRSPQVRTAARSRAPTA